jgi:hypothetical protein
MTVHSFQIRDSQDEQLLDVGPGGRRVTLEGLGGEGLS